MIVWIRYWITRVSSCCDKFSLNISLKQKNFIQLIQSKSLGVPIKHKDEIFACLNRTNEMYTVNINVDYHISERRDSGVFLWWSFRDPRVGLDDPWGFLPTWIFYDSIETKKSSHLLKGAWSPKWRTQKTWIQLNSTQQSHSWDIIFLPVFASELQTPGIHFLLLLLSCYHKRWRFINSIVTKELPLYIPSTKQPLDCSF